MTEETVPPDRPATEAALEALVAVARRLAAADRLAARGTDGAAGPAPADPLLVAVTETAAVVLEAQAASIALHDPASDRLVFVAAAGPAAGDVVGLAIDAAAGIAGYAFSTGQPLAVADVAADPRFDRTVAEATGYVPGTLLATPLVDADGTMGVLEVLDRRGGTFTLRDLDTAAALAREAAIIVRRGAAGREATNLLRSSLTALFGNDAAEGADRAPDVDILVAAVAERLATDEDDPAWRLADGIARLVDRDPDRMALAIEWVDALVRHSDRPGRSGRSGR
jgi:GAF domain-containing protein